MMHRRFVLGGLILLMLGWAGCELLEEEPADLDMLAGTWAFQEVRVTVDGEERNVTSSLFENVDESELTFEHDRTFLLALTRADNRVERGGTYRLDSGSSTLTLEMQDDGPSGRFDYEIRSEGRQVVLVSEDASFLAAILDIDSEDVDVSAIERVELVLQQRA